MRISKQFNKDLTTLTIDLHIYTSGYRLNNRKPPRLLDSEKIRPEGTAATLFQVEIVLNIISSFISVGAQRALTYPVFKKQLILKPFGTIREPQGHNFW